MKRNWKSEEKLLIFLNQANIEQELNLDLIQLELADVDWNNFEKLVRENQVSALTFKNLKVILSKYKQDTPPQLTETIKNLESSSNVISDQGEKRSHHLNILLKKAQASQLEVILLKGSLFANQIYHDSGYKKMNDVDLLIKKSEVYTFTKLLQSLGFKSVGALLGKKEVSNSQHHSGPYVSADLTCVIGLHWGLASPMSRWKPDTIGIWNRKQPIELEPGLNAWRMSWEDNLLHLCIHLPFYKTGLRELADVFNLVRTQNIDWSKFSRLVRKWHAQDAVYRVLSIADALVDLQIPPDLLKTWRGSSSVITLRDTRKRLKSPSLILYSRSTQAAKIEKAYAVFALTENYSEKVKAFGAMWLFLLWPKDSEIAKLAGFSGSHGRARLEAPLYLWRALARDHGHLPLAAMTVANVVSLARDTTRQILMRPKAGKKLREGSVAKLLEALE